MTPRVDSEIVIADEKSVVELYKIHVDCSNKIALARTQGPSKRLSTASIQSGYRTLNKFTTMKRNSEAIQKGLSCCHLLLTFKALRCDVGDPAMLCFAIYDPAKACYTRFVVDIYLFILLPCVKVCQEIWN